MIAVVQRGTGTSGAVAARFYPLAGKTGIERLGSPRGRSHSWFARLRKPAGESILEVALSVVVENVGYGAMRTPHRLPATCCEPRWRLPVIDRREDLQ